jgi:amidase
MARFVEDLSLLLPIIAGPDWIDPFIVPMPLGDPAAVQLKQLRVAFHTDNGIRPPTPETATVVRQAATILADAGVLVEEARPRGIEYSYEMVRELWAADGGASIRRLLHEAGTTQHTFSHLRLAQQPTFGAELDAQITTWAQLRSVMLSFWQDYDVILCPVNAFPALPHGTSDDNLDAFSYTITYNMTGWPGAVVRGGTSQDGLPIGVQIVAQPWREDVALAVAKYLEQQLGTFPAAAL